MIVHHIVQHCWFKCALMLLNVTKCYLLVDITQWPTILTKHSLVEILILSRQYLMWIHAWLRNKSVTLLRNIRTQKPSFENWATLLDLRQKVCKIYFGELIYPFLYFVKKNTMSN